MKKKSIIKTTVALALVGLGMLLVGCSPSTHPPAENTESVQEESESTPEVTQTEEAKTEDVTINIDEMIKDRVKVAFEEPVYSEADQTVKVTYTIFNQTDAAIRPSGRILAFLQDGTPVDLGIGTRSIPAKDSYEGTLELGGIAKGTVMYWNLIGEASSNATAESLVMPFE